MATTDTHIKHWMKKVAERVGFEPTALDESPVFKTGSLNHSDISPHLIAIRGELYITIGPAFCQALNCILSNFENATNKSNKG